jgi:hypothetical protein
MFKIGTLFLVGAVIAPLLRASEVAGDGKWTLGTSVAVIADNTTFGLLRNQGNDADGDAGGLIYQLDASYRLKVFNFQVGDHIFHPTLELRGGLGFVDENSGKTFMNYSAEAVFHWRDFPWNEYVATSFGIGGGLLYSEKVLAIDRIRHPGEERSHFKFSLPLELTFALPKYPQLQLLLFNHHFSGAHVFDEGGFDTFGGGLRYQLEW